MKIKLNCNVGGCKENDEKNNKNLKDLSNLYTKCTKYLLSFIKYMCRPHQEQQTTIET